MEGDGVAGPLRILVADDHPQTVHACQSALEAAGFTVLTAASLGQASRIVADGRLWLVVLDAGLTGGDVLRFCGSLHENAAAKRVRLFLLVPPRLPELRLSALRPFCDECIFKPFQVSELIERIKARMASAREYGTGSGTSADLGVREAAPIKPVSSGTIIAGCRIERVLGKGASGTVYLGRHLTLDVPVAIKLVSASLAYVGAKDLERFVRGARAAIRIQHPNVVPVLNAGKQGEFHFLIQRYIEGETLKARIATHGRLGQDVVTRMLGDIGAGLCAVHGHGIAHRDVKPGNIIVTPPGVAMLADFGLARRVGQGYISSANDIVGTLYYMSPEQCDARGVDGRSDLYSLGATAYHALVGRVPIQGDTPVAVLRGHIERIPPSPGEIVPEVSEKLSQVIMKLLAKSPDARYQSAEDLCNALKRVSASR